MADILAKGTLTIKTSAPIELIDVTREINRVVAESGVSEGIIYLFNPHTTAGITINEGSDPEVKSDIIAGLQEMVPMHLHYRHMEGNSPSHIMASLIGSSLSIFIDNSSCSLGTWQKVYFCDFDGPRTRKLHYKILYDLSSCSQRKCVSVFQRAWINNHSPFFSNSSAGRNSARPLPPELRALRSTTL